MRIVLWDIDGTLVTTAGAGRRAIDRAFLDLYGWTDATRGLRFDGRTDPWIVDETLRARDFAAGTIVRERARVLAAYVERLQDEMRAPPGSRPFGPLPGVATAIDRLARRSDCAIGLLTGNIEPGARAKLGAFDLWQRFPFGAFGDDAETRPDLLPVALARAGALLGRRFRAADAIVIGDTERDVEVGRVHGARTLAVATGSTTADELRASGADRVVATLEDFASLERWIFDGDEPGAVAGLDSRTDALR